MLTNGFNHVAIVTADMERFKEFYTSVFGAEVLRDGPEGPSKDMQVRLAIIKVGPQSELNVFEFPANTERHTPMFGRGPLDHMALEAASLEAFDEIRDRLMARGAADDFVTDFGQGYSVFFRDPDGLECEVCVANPDARPGVFNPPGTRAARYS
ncbi:MAG TPA: VOC family protein [Acidimicrobiales bacterium]|nr:VOC family protein [Acidimicrobiales bacterium]